MSLPPRLRRFLGGEDPGGTLAALAGACGFPLAFFAPLVALLTYEFGSPLVNFDGSPAAPLDAIGGMVCSGAAWWLVGVIPASWAADRFPRLSAARRAAASFAAAAVCGTAAAGLCLPAMLF